MSTTTAVAPNVASAIESLKTARGALLQAAYNGSRDNSSVVLAFDGEREWTVEEARLIRKALHFVEEALGEVIWTEEQS